jgi:hypothetical protein
MGSTVVGEILGQRKVPNRITLEEGSTVRSFLTGSKVDENRQSWISTRSVRPDVRPRKTSDTSMEGGRWKMVWGRD